MNPRIELLGCEPDMSTIGAVEAETLLAAELGELAVEDISFEAG